MRPNSTSILTAAPRVGKSQVHGAYGGRSSQGCKAEKPKTTRHRVIGAKEKALLKGFEAIQAFFGHSEKTQAEKTSKISEKLKQIIQKLNILPTRINFFLHPKAHNFIDLALKFI